MTWLWSLLGGALVLVTVRDIFNTLWQPRGFGPIARVLFWSVWHLTKRAPLRPSLEVAGPLALMVTAAAWTVGLVLGFALIYLPHVPQGFVFASEIDSPGSSPLSTSVYLSFVALATLGFGDVTPAYGWLQLLIPLEALLGFVLLTAIISWVLQLYPALVRRRAIARRLASMAATGTDDLIPRAEASIAVQLLEDVRAQLSTVEVDFEQYPETYYFHEHDRDLSLAVQLTYVPTLIEAAEQSPAEEVRHAGRLLANGLDGITNLLARQFFRGSDAEEKDSELVLPRYAKDHGQL